MKKYKETLPEQSLEMYCLECETLVYQCDGCNEYFTPDTKMFCEIKSVNGYHLCEICKTEEYS